MEAGTIILEPEYDFTLEIPASMIGHAMTDLQSMYAVMEAPEQLGDRAIIRGHGPVATLRDYQLHVRAFTKGQGEFQVSFRGYMPCHNEEEVIQTHPYDPEADLRNPTSSVFCAHGSGFLVFHKHLKSRMNPFLHAEICPDIRKLCIERNKPLLINCASAPRNYQPSGLPNLHHRR